MAGRKPYIQLVGLVKRVHSRDEYRMVDRRYLQAFVLDVVEEAVEALKDRVDVWIPSFGKFTIIESTRLQKRKPNAGVYRLKFRIMDALREEIANIERAHPDLYKLQIPQERLENVRYGDVAKEWRRRPPRSVYRKYPEGYKAHWAAIEANEPKRPRGRPRKYFK